VVKRAEKKTRKLERFVLFLFLGLFVAAGVGMTVLFRQTHREYATHKARKAYYEQRLSDGEAKLKEKEETLHRLHYDPAFIERTLRQRYGYAKSGELVFRFEEHEENVK
jgi:cell division protein FtsB